MQLDYETLKARHRETRDSDYPDTRIRIHRALSWLQRAEKETDDLDARFLFLWIAFNGAYAQELGDPVGFSERQAQRTFFALLVTHDKDRLLYKAIWDEFPQSVRNFLDNPFVYPGFWKFQTGSYSERAWEEDFQSARKKMHLALQRGDTGQLLAGLFERLYVLRNQLIHGSATWNSSLNRTQLRDGTRILGSLVPLVISVIMGMPDDRWGPIAFPVLDI